MVVVVVVPTIIELTWNDSLLLKKIFYVKVEIGIYVVALSGKFRPQMFENLLLWHEFW